jgi:predicted nucleic acid-binding Zn ribbon protein
MHCPSCGTAVTPGLSYCKHCGSELNGKERNLRKSSELPPGILVPAIAFTFVAGMGVLIGLIAVMKNYNLNEGLINGFAVLTFLVMVIIEAIFIWLLLRSTLGRRGADDPAQAKRATTNELRAGEAPALPEPRMSVTEHTTRTLEPSRDAQ